jgi:hypothetical protein
MKTKEQNEVILKKAIKASATRPRHVNSAPESLGSPLSPSEGAKVKLDLAARNNDNLMAFASQHDADMKDNANFPSPLPPAPDFEATMDAFGQAVLTWMSARSAADAAASAMATARAALETALNHRANYVEIASNGNANIIQTAGFAVRNPRTPAAPLDAPTGLAVDLNGVAGLMVVSWNADPAAKGYLVQISEDVTPRVWEVQPRVSVAKMSFSGMTVGTTYVFQAAALGGSTGQSPWSPEVIRAAA